MAGCGGDDGPTAPPGPLQVAGTYTGPAEFSVSGVIITGSMWMDVVQAVEPSSRSAHHNVFNAEQADGLPARPIPTAEPFCKVHQHAERVLEDSGVPVRHMAGELIQQSCLKHGVQPQVLTLHSDRGAPMTSQCTAQLLADLGVTRSLSRPQVSDDNPFSEAQFSTIPRFPGGSRIRARPRPSVARSSVGIMPSTAMAASRC